jgi:malto-oligosyltrehalose trehalohydrolase
MNDLNPDGLTITLQRAHRMKFGTEITDRGVRFRMWAPKCEALGLCLEPLSRPLAMTRLARGWFELEVDGARHGDRYKFILPDGTQVPDPASRYQPLDVHGPSEVVDPRTYGWQDAGWRGRPWEETVLYELHIGTFTPQGTFRAAIDKLDHLVELGITAVEIMPVADFRGKWNWGYDGVQHFAPDASYGRPEDLKALIDAAHRRSLMVVLDVVYNHFGPDGNYMGLYAPLLTNKHETPWGPAVNVDDEGAHMVRDYITANARYWLDEFHIDGLRFDAVQEIRDSGPRHLLYELAEKLRATTDGRHVHLMVENAANQAGWMKRRADGTPGLYTAQWSDDIHHALHCAITGESHWYYADFHGQPNLLGRALAEGLAYQGEIVPSEGEAKGEPSSFLPPTAFVSYIQNHDQVGNRPLGDRLVAKTPVQALRAAAAINLLCPHIPLVFMGEEWGTSQPFMFFSDMGPELAGSIRESRQKEFAASPDARDASKYVPDPMAADTFARSKLDWRELGDATHDDWLNLYRKLLALRQAEIIPRLAEAPGGAASFEVVGPGAVKVRWTLGDGSVLSLLANLSPEPLDGVDMWGGRHIWLEGAASGQSMSPWTVIWSIEDPTPKSP